MKELNIEMDAIPNKKESSPASASIRMPPGMPYFMTEVESQFAQLIDAGKRGRKI